MCVVQGSLFLDGGISVADRVFGEVLFKDTSELLHVWTYLPRHPLQVSVACDSSILAHSISINQLSLVDSFADSAEIELLIIARK